MSTGSFLDLNTPANIKSKRINCDLNLTFSLKRKQHKQSLTGFLEDSFLKDPFFPFSFWRMNHINVFLSFERLDPSPASLLPSAVAYLVFSTEVVA